MEKLYMWCEISYSESYNYYFSFYGKDSMHIIF